MVAMAVLMITPYSISCLNVNYFLPLNQLEYAPMLFQQLFIVPVVDSKFLMTKTRVFNYTS